MIMHDDDDDDHDSLFSLLEFSASCRSQTLPHMVLLVLYRMEATVMADAAVVAPTRY
jgi:hypothetical protein